MGFYRFALADLEVTVLSDGFLRIPSDIFGDGFEAADVLAMDVDPEARAEYLRSRLVPTDEMPTQASILGYHFPFPGLGYAVRSGDAYRWHPAGWRVLS